MAARSTVARDPCVVKTAPLAAVLQPFVTEWNHARPPNTGRQFTAPGTEDVAMVSALQWLAAETGVNARTIQNVLSRRSQRTEFWIADALVAAVNVPEAWHDGTLLVEPNPAAPPAARASCCGGSMTMRF